MKDKHEDVIGELETSTMHRTAKTSLSLAFSTYGRNRANVVPSLALSTYLRPQQSERRADSTLLYLHTAETERTAC